jgi:hypothetical protein
MTLENIFKNIIRNEEIAEQFIPKDRRIKTYAWRSDILSKNWILNTFRSDLQAYVLIRLSFGMNCSAISSFLIMFLNIFSSVIIIDLVVGTLHMRL